MNLLLLLSALLSALTGVGGSARGAERPQAVAAVSVGRSAAALAPRHVTSRPANALPTIVALAVGYVVTPVLAIRGAPIWADRRRE